MREAEYAAYVLCMRHKGIHAITHMHTHPRTYADACGHHLAGIPMEGAHGQSSVQDHATFYTEVSMRHVLHAKEAGLPRPSCVLIFVSSCLHVIVPMFVFK